MSTHHRNRRPVLTYWVPLVTTLSLATIGLVTWALHAQSSESDAYDSDSDCSSTTKKNRKDRRTSTEQAFGVDGAGTGTGLASHPSGNRPDGDSSFQFDDDRQNRPIVLVDQERELAEGHVGGQHGDHASRTATPFQVVRDASSAVARAFSAVAGETKEWLTESNRDSTWGKDEEERGAHLAAATSAAAEQGGFAYVPGSSVVQPPNVNAQDKMVVVVVANTETNFLFDLPLLSQSSNIRLIVLLYTPEGGEKSQLGADELHSSSSSYAAVSYPNTPATSYSVPVSGSRSSSRSRLDHGPTSLDRVRSAALSLVGDETCLIQFSTPGGWVPTVCHLRPALMYIPASMALEAGPGGESRARQVMPWVGSEVLVQKPGENVYPDAQPDGKRLALIDERSVLEDWTTRVYRV